MTHLLNLRLPKWIVILFGSVLFYFIIVVAIYLFLVWYWINKTFFSHDRNVRIEDAAITLTGYKIAKRITRKKLSRLKIRPFSKL